MSSLRTVHLTLPASTADLRALSIGDVVYLTGRVFTAREGVYKRAVEDGYGLPGPPAGMGAPNFHFSPAAPGNDDGTYTLGAGTAAASFPFPKWLERRVYVSKCHLIIGKGGLPGAD